MIPQDTPVQVITTARLALRGPKDSGGASLAAFLTRPRAEWIGGPFPDEDAAEQLDWQYAQWAEPGRGSWIVALRQDNTPIGRVGLLEHEGWPEPKLGRFLFDGFEGQCYAHEAALAARAHVAETPSPPPLFNLIEAANTRSRRLVERLGAPHERECQVFRHPDPRASI